MKWKWKVKLTFYEVLKHKPMSLTHEDVDCLFGWSYDSLQSVVVELSFHSLSNQVLDSRVMPN